MDQTIKEIGERGLLALFEKLVDPGDLPFNDDAVAFSLTNGMSMVVNIDTFVGKTDAPPNMTPAQMGAKAVTMAISDLAAKGTKPQFVIASGAFPADFPVEQTVELVKGIRDTAHKYEAKFLGGDTNAADDIILSIVAFGESKKSDLITRSGAQENDVICTTGKFGLTGAGFKVFLEDFSASLPEREAFSKAIYSPEARVKEGLILQQFSKVNSCIDSSDGLAWCLFELLRNKKDFGIEINTLPIASEASSFAAKHNLQPENLALYGGEEFELVFTVQEKHLESLRKQIDIFQIGRITRDNPRKILLKLKNQSKEIFPKGWEHFKE